MPISENMGGQKMCVISIKTAGQRKWTRVELGEMIAHNPDGSGFMYFDRKAKSVKIEKGFFSVDKAFNYLRRLPDDAPIVFHARIATHGAKCQGLCHPFPLYAVNSDKYLAPDDMVKSRLSCSVGLAHNGVLSLYPESDLSDTATFALFVNRHFSVEQLPYLWEVLQGSSMVNGSRLVTLDSNGEIRKLGQWQEADGFFYSNLFFRKQWWKRTEAGGLYNPYLYDWDEIDTLDYYKGGKWNY